MKADAHFCNIVYLFLQNIVGKAIFRNTVPEPSPRFWTGFKNINVVAFLPKEERSRNPTGACSYYGNFLSGLRLNFRHKFVL